MINAVFAALSLSSNGAELKAIRPSDDQLAPVEVIVRKLPDLEDPYEMQRHKHEKLEAERRKFERLDLAEHRGIWAEKQIESYRFTVSTRGAWFGTPPVIVTVRGGQVVSTEYACQPNPCNANEVVPANAEPYETVPNLFAAIGKLLNHPNTLPSVQYDTQYGYPTTIWNDRWEASDDEFTVRVWDFQVIE